MVVFATGWNTLSACLSSTLFFSVIKELSDDIYTSVTSINLANVGISLTLDTSTLICASSGL